MGHRHQSESSATGVVVAVMAVLLLLLIGGFVAFAGVWLARTSAREARMARDEAMVAMQKDALAQEAAARAQAEELANELRASASAPQRLATIRIDDEGNVLVDDKLIVDLRSTLNAMRSGANGENEVLIEVDPRCTAATVLDVVQTCYDIGFDEVRLAPLNNEEPEASASSER